MKKRIILAGGSGFIGQALTHFLTERGYEIAVLTRQRSHGRFVQWDGRSLGNWTRELEDAHALVNLIGKTINCRHTPENRREILQSRVDSVRVLGHAIAQSAQPPRVFVQAAGVGIYGDRWCDEAAAHGEDFVTEVCEKWEGAFDEITASQTRKVLLRLGVVLGHDGGFLKVLGGLTRAFLGGKVGDGCQFISWIHLKDLMRMILETIERDDLAGVFNSCAPNPVTNADFMRELRRALHRPWSPPVPKFAARIGSWLLGTEAELAFVSQRCAPKHFLECGFRFEFAELPSTLTQLYPNS